MASNPKPSFVPEIGPDGIAKESPAIAYAEKIIEEEQLQLKRYIQENYSKIRDVEKELENLTFELKLTAGPKRAALEHLRKKIEVINEKICAAKLKEEQTKQILRRMASQGRRDDDAGRDTEKETVPAWEAAAQVVKDEEAVKQKLCDDLNQLVQESAHTQHSRLEELRRRLEALNPSRVSSDVSPTHNNTTDSLKAMQQATNYSSGKEVPLSSGIFDGNNQQKDAQTTGKKRTMNPPKTKNIVLKSRAGESGWTGAGFDVDGRT
ncbi:hypothetical protein KSP39_PZI008455 [Platanthera zijinensis]|uniref:RAB6-interacting golgin n=1 Tax=Platanthera zijinensis TaxID=2320716 RepID=A0AAP0BN70_9ASPA